MTQTFTSLGFVAHLGALERDIAAVGPAIAQKWN
jgi:hypothetical protein